MANTDFILNNLPIFFTEQLNNPIDGSNPLNTIYSLFSNVLGDGFSKALQNLNSRSIQRIDPLSYEYFKTFDISNPISLSYIILDSSYTYLYYKIDDSTICGVDNFYSDSLMQNIIPTTFVVSSIPVTTYYIFKDLTTGTKYIGILVDYLASLSKLPTQIFSKIIYHNDRRLANTYGVLVDYVQTIVEYISIDSSGKFYKCDLNTAISNAILYKKELIGLFYVLWNGPTVKDINIGLSIYVGLPYVEFDGTVTQINSGSTNIITIQSLDKTKTKNYSFTQNINSNIGLGVSVSKFDILAESAANIIDYFSDPVSFKNFIQTNITSLIGINLSNNEQYPHLNWDNPNLQWDDDCPLYWDMGEFVTGDPDFLTDSTYSYEEFRNIFIISSTYSASVWQSKFELFLNKIKPIYTKYILSMA